MKKNINFSDCTIKLKAACQITDSHCGPAVIQTYLSFYGINVTQNEVVTATRTKSKVIRYGFRPVNIAKAIEKLAPDYQFWFKQYATKEDLDTLIHTHHLPVGVNWQGLFYDTVELEKIHKPEGDNGHYAVVIDIDLKKDEIVIADPFSEYCHTPRIFSCSWFETRWWDYDEVKEQSSQEKIFIHTRQLLFVVLPKGSPLSSELNLSSPELLSCLLSSDPNA
jgi:ABC-type bacteriocin/lantibiotic exporter with double-glycine peptidase domain